MNNISIKGKRGFGVVEVLIGATIVTVGLAGLLIATQKMVQTSRNNENVVKSSILLEEGIEALRLMRDRSWTTEIASLSDDTTYYFEYSGGFWMATTTATTTDGAYTRTFVLDNVTRDVNNDISDGGTADAGTRKFTVTVTFPISANATGTKSISGYLTNFFSN